MQLASGYEHLWSPQKQARCLNHSTASSLRGQWQWQGSLKALPLSSGPLPLCTIQGISLTLQLWVQHPQGNQSHIPWAIKCETLNSYWSSHSIVNPFIISLHLYFCTAQGGYRLTEWHLVSSCSFWVPDPNGLFYPEIMCFCWLAALSWAPRVQYWCFCLCYVSFVTDSIACVTSPWSCISACAFRVILETSGNYMSPKISKFDSFLYSWVFYILQHLVLKRSIMLLKRSISRAIDMSLKQCFAVLN